MDFQICPSCQQSVLEDDVEVCPFCGASMKGPPVKTAKPTPAAKKSPALTKAPAAKGATKPAENDDILTHSDDVKQAIPASARPTKQRTQAIQCPMCETTGYIPKEAAGKPVKCANPQCLVPVFVAPAPEAPPAPPPAPKPQGPGVAVWGGGAVALVLIGGGLAYFFATQTEKTPATSGSMTSEDLALLNSFNEEANKVPGKSAAGTSDTTTATTTTENPPVNSAAPSGTDVDAILQRMADLSLVSQQNRSKPFCRRLTAEAAASAGRLPRALEQLDALKAVGRDVPYFTIPVDCELFWQYRIAKDEAAAAKHAEAVKSAIARLPKFGRTRLQFSGQAAAVLVAAGLTSDAEQLLATQSISDTSGQLAAWQVQTLSTDDQNLYRIHENRPIAPWQQPQRVAAITTLVLRDAASTARDWVGATSDATAREEAMTAWSVAYARRTVSSGQPFDWESIAALAASSEPAGLVNLYARLGQALASLDQDDLARKALELATRGVAELPPPSEQTMPEVRQVPGYRLPNRGGIQRQVVAMGEVARLQSQLGDQEGAKNSLQAALAYGRSLAPALPLARERLSQAEQAPPAVLRNQLKAALDLKNDDEARVASVNYRKSLQDIQTAAQERFSTQTRLLEQAIDWGMGTAVLEYISANIESEDASRREPFAGTTLIPALLASFEQAGQSDQVAAINQLLTRAGQKQVPAASGWTLVWTQMDKDVGAAAQSLGSIPSSEQQADAIALVGVSRLVQFGKPDAALAFAAKVSDQALREECYQQIAAQQSKTGNTADLTTAMEAIPQVTEKLSVAWGLVQGAPGKPR